MIYIFRVTCLNLKKKAEALIDNISVGSLEIKNTKYILEFFSTSFSFKIQINTFVF